MVSSPEKSVIRLRTLGQLDLDSTGGREVHGALAQPRRAALLAYLALATPRGHHRRDALLALFWPESDIERARNALNQAVHFLRLSLGGGTIINRNGDDALALDWDSVWCDAVAFEEALAAGRTADALELYRGDLLPGFHVGDAPEFDRWLDAERARYADRYAEALEAMAEERERAGDFSGAVGYWKRLAGRDGYNSVVALRLMRALAAMGDAAGALQHARVHTVLLREELGLAPNAEIGALVEQLQSGQAAGPARAVRLPEAVHDASRPMIRSAEVVHPRPMPGVREVAARHRRLTLTLGLVALSAAVAGWAALRGHPQLIRSIAVLPFEDLSADTTNHTFAAGMFDVIITDLAHYPEMSVKSRTSAEQYKTPGKRLPDVARELDVDAIVEGTVIRDGSRVRVTAKLVHGQSDRLLWAGRYDGDLRDMLVLQVALADSIARAVRRAGGPSRPADTAVVGRQVRLPNELSRRLYMRGRDVELSRSPLGIETAKDAYRLAIEHDSTFAAGYAGLAGVYGFIADYALGPAAPALDSARIMARRAVALDSTLPEAHTALAVSLGDGGQFAAAEREFQRATQLGPKNAHAHYWYSVLLVALGRGADAKRESEVALSLDSIRPRGVVAMQRYAQWLMTGKRPYLKLPVAERRGVLKLEPGEPWARGRAAIEFAQEGRCDDAHTAIARAQQYAPNNIRTLSLLAQVYWRCGERPRARALLNEMKKRPDAKEHGLRIAAIYALVGEKDSAFVWLHRHRWTLSSLSALSAGYEIDSLRSDPRFAILTRKIGIR